MSTSSPDRTCPRCGGPLPGEPDGLCPRCLLAEAMEPTRSGEAFASAPTLTPEELAPHFPALEIVRCLGRGGMGVVYEARQRSLNRRVALKLLAPERADDPRFAARFEREAQALAALSHPHIVAVHDFGRAGGFYYLLMEFVDGLNLRQLLRSRRLSPREALAIVPPVCDALQCAHDHGIVHRDIKPENLLIDRAGTVKIADFGIAALVGPRDGDAPATDSAAKASVTLALGTPDYAAPEQASGAVDARADIYSLGVVLYEMLTGERPSGPIEPPSRRVRLDVRIDEVVLRALESSPARRYATAAEFGARVDAVTVADTPASPPPPPLKIGTGTLTTADQLGIPRGSRWPMWMALAAPILIAFALVTQLLQSGRNLPPLPFPALGLGPGEILILLVLGFFWSRRRKQRPNRVAVILLVWTLFHLAFVLLVLGSRSMLPVNPAGHFNSVGLGDRWVSRDTLLWTTALLPPALGLLFLAVAPLVRTVPARFIRVPRPDYWLAPERRPQLVAEILSSFSALSCLFTLFFAGLHTLVIMANRQSPPILPSTPLLFLVIAFLLLVLLWLVAFVVRLARAGDLPDRSPAEVSVRILFMVWLAAATVGGGMVLGRYLRAPSPTLVQLPEEATAPLPASDPRWMEIVQEGGETQPPSSIGTQRIAGWHRVRWVIRASRSGWVEFRHAGAPLVAPLVLDEHSGLHQRSLYVEIRGDEGAGVKYGYRLGEPEWPDAPNGGNDGRADYEALSREMDASARSSIRPSRGREVEVFRLDGRPATLRLLEGPTLPPSASRDIALASAMEAIQSGQFCLLGIPGQTPTNLTHDAETGYPILWLPVGGPAESLELFNETMSAWHRKQAESWPER